MEWRGRAPSQPSNFVSLLHLRERWLKENERNQKEKEEQELLEQQLQQQEVQRTEPEEKNDQKPAVQKPRIRTISSSRSGSGRLPRYRRASPASNSGNVKETCKKTEDEGKPPVADPPIESVEKKKKARKKHRKKNPRAQNEEMDKTSKTPEESLKEKARETKCEVGEKNVKRMECEEKKEMGLGSQCGPEIGLTHEMKEIESKLGRISVSFEIKRGRSNGVYRGRSQGNRNFSDHRNHHHWVPRKLRDVGMMWVRKDELSKGA